jgi:DNA-binding MarR family transcriptional regulator
MADTATLALLLGRLSRLSEAAVAEVCIDHGTTPAELRVMSFLAYREDGQASPSDIATFVVQTSGGLTATLRRLETEGLVARAADPSDGRGRLVVLTAVGFAFHAQVLAVVVEQFERTVVLVDLDAAEAVVRSLVEAFEIDHGVPSSAGFVADSSYIPTEFLEN